MNKSELTLPDTNPQSMGFSRSTNALKDNYKKYQKNIKPLGNSVFSRGSIYLRFCKKS